MSPVIFRARRVLVASNPPAQRSSNPSRCRKQVATFTPDSGKSLLRVVHFSLPSNAIRQALPPRRSSERRDLVSFRSRRVPKIALHRNPPVTVPILRLRLPCEKRMYRRKRSKQNRSWIGHNTRLRRHARYALIEGRKSLLSSRLADSEALEHMELRAKQKCTTAREQLEFHVTSSHFSVMSKHNSGRFQKLRRKSLKACLPIRRRSEPPPIAGRPLEWRPQDARLEYRCRLPHWKRCCVARSWEERYEWFRYKS